MSYTGNSWMTRIRVSTVQSTIAFRSPKSPTPQLPSLRNEKTGMTTPAAFQRFPRIRNGESEITTTSSFATPLIGSTRFSPPSHATKSPVFASMTTYLYSMGKVTPAALKVTLHSYSPVSFMRNAKFGFHSPNAGWLPRRANACPSSS